MDSDDSLSAGSSRGGETTTHRTGDGSTTIIIRETHPAYKTRFAMVFSIAICTVVASVTIFAVAWKGDMQTFETEYKSKVEHIVGFVQWKAEYYIALTEQLSATVTIAANASESVFPFLTLQNFEYSAGFARGMTEALVAGYAPLVTSSERSQWEQYAKDNQDWLRDSYTLQEVQPEYHDPLHGLSRRLQEEPIPPRIFRWSNGTRVVEDDGVAGIFAPIWHMSPPSAVAINMNLFSNPFLNNLASMVLQSKKTVMSKALVTKEINDILFSSDADESVLLGSGGNTHLFFMSPVFDSFHEGKEVVGVVFTVSSLVHFLDHTVPGNAKGLVAVIQDSCSRAYTFRLNEKEGTTLELAASDTHDPKYDKYEERGTIEASFKDEIMEDLCTFSVSIYPSDLYRARFNSTGKAIIKVGAVLAGFLCCAIVLYFYDKTVTQKHEQTVRKARRTEELVGTLFPEAVRDRVLKNDDEREDGLADDAGTGRPIADFFPHTSLMFADIAGFTAWSSARDPSQVFELLETIYGEFDALAKKRRVFKVETVGDCYVAACGLPKRRKDHAVTMARFARDCLLTMNEIGPRLETSLGPETSALKFRIGCHSGPVTAGVLRADNARYQIFGDTVNTAARMEHTGVPNRIQISSTMADLLIKAGKGHWISPRNEAVVAKGKGELQTYWLEVDADSNTNDDTTSCSSIGFDIIELETADQSGDEGENINFLPQKTRRMVEWNTEVLSRLLNKVVARRNRLGRQMLLGKPMKSSIWNKASSPNTTVLSEVEEIIRLPPIQTYKEDTEEQVQVDATVYEELRDYVAQIARHYRDNAFHSFDHASHVAMSVVKMMNRIVAPQDHLGGDAATLHATTYGITSDPLTQFACVFSALIHDCDHPGVPNSHLAKEDESLHIKYGGQSLAEQRSVDLAWAILLDDKYQNLRNTLCVDVTELKRFRQLLVNSVMATDVMDKQLKELRNNRWQRAFSESILPDETPDDTLHRKATIVIEHLIQASDISHTMQHWHIYRTWNEKLFREMYNAYLAGRSDTDPSKNWYTGEIGFFDFYVIPLARKLKDCGVFGVSSDEYLSYALQNREEWASKGQQIVEEMMRKVGKERDIVVGKLDTASSTNKQPTGMKKMLRRLSAKSASIRSLVRKASDIDTDDDVPAQRRVSRSGSQRGLFLKSTSQRSLQQQQQVNHHSPLAVDNDSNDHRVSPTSTTTSDQQASAIKPVMNRTASMKALMKQVWDESDVLLSPPPVIRRSTSSSSSKRKVMHFT